jgi:hypothetical protein
MTTHERGDQVGRVLAVGVHRQGVREAGRLRLVQPVQHRGALSTVAFEHPDRQPRVAPGHRLQPGRGAVGAAVDDHPHGIPHARAAATVS